MFFLNFHFGVNFRRDSDFQHRKTENQNKSELREKYFTLRALYVISEFKNTRESNVIVKEKHQVKICVKEDSSQQTDKNKSRGKSFPPAK